jgi:hypothetical protein
MIEFTLNMPEVIPSVVTRPVATVKVLDNLNDLRVEAAMYGHEEMTEARGITFNMEDDVTHYRFSLIFLNKERLDIETLQHEVRHAYLWNIAKKDGGVTINVHNELEEEGFSRRLDTLVNRAVCTIESTLGMSLKWKVI